jgi:putative transposase
MATRAIEAAKWPEKRRHVCKLRRENHASTERSARHSACAGRTSCPCHTPSTREPPTRRCVERLFLLIPKEREAIAYAMANPVIAGIGERAEDWCGVLVTPAHLARTTTLVGMTEGIAYLHLRKETSWSLPVVLPPMVTEAGASQTFAAEVRRRVTLAEDRARDERKENAWKVYGAKDAMALHWTTRAVSEEQLFQPVPTVKCRRTPERIALLATLKAFRVAYREAMTAFCHGVKDALFPYGTWKMVALFGARAALP